MSFRYNIVVVGITGVGKSSLINYLYGKKIRASGVGKPVSQRGFHPIEISVNNLPVTLYDSWGLEVGKDKEWMEGLEKELEKRGLDKSAEEWFHSVYYCISAGGARVQDFDIKIIKKFLDEKYKVTVVFTKSDTISEDDANRMISALGEYKNLPKIFVCAEEKKRLDGSVTKTFGKEEFKSETLKGFWDSLILRLPARYENIIETTINNFIASVNSEHINNLSWAGLNKSEVHKSIFEDSRLFINKVLNKKTTEFIKELGFTLDNYKIFAEELNLKPDGFKFKVDDFNIKLYQEDDNFYEALKETLRGERKTKVKSDMQKLINKFSEELILDQKYKRNEIERILIQIRDASISYSGGGETPNNIRSGIKGHCVADI